MKARRWYVLAAVAAIVVVVMGARLAANAQGGPSLVNGDFEGAFTPRGAGEVVVAEGWDPYWLSGDDRECREPCFRPEFQPETVIAQAGKSQRYFTTFARQFAGIYQRVGVEQNQWYEFSCAVYNISEPNGRNEVFLGINPWGADPMHRTMIWGKGYVTPYRTWTRVSVMAQAWGDTITVATGANNDWPTQNNASYWDNCSVRLVSGPSGPTPTPRPTYTPYPTNTPQPCPTCAPGTGCDYERIKDDVATVIAEWDRR
jgi:hypothetical protein